FPGMMILSLVVGCSDTNQTALPNMELAGIPDLSQAPLDKVFSENRTTLCAPVTVANSISWIEGNTAPDHITELAMKFSSREYMSTSPYSGTSPNGVLRGVDVYLNEVDIEFSRLEYAGWRRVNHRHQASEPLSIQWMVNGLKQGSAVWLNLGWYDVPVPGYYRRLSGHWVVLTGYRDGKFIIHDPGPWADPDLDPQAVVAIPRSPLVVKSEHDYLFPAPDLIELKKARSPFGERTMIDGAIILNAVRSSDN
ncbi:MAG: C39 family peptidase, partial [bacterium]